MIATEKTAHEIENVLKEYARAYAHKDLNAMMKIMAHDEDLIFVGTGEDEWVQGPKQLEEGFKRDLSQIDSIKVNFGDIPVSSSGNVAWTATLMTMYVQIEDEILSLEGRLSAVFEKRIDSWLIVHLHFSIPAQDQEEGQSFPPVNTG
jgi:ketosteroid isomerase-like protein